MSVIGILFEKESWMIRVSRGHLTDLLSCWELMYAIKGRWTVTGACGPYNLGGSATEWYQSDRYKVFLVLVYKTSK